MTYKSLKLNVLNCALACIFLSLAACSPDNDAKVNHKKKTEPASTPKYLNEFETWKKSQDQQLLLDYQNYFKGKVKQVPTLYELTLNSHPLKAECLQHRFSLPPKKLWGNLIKPLQLIEHLQEQKYFAHYKIVSVYRSREANTCVLGAKASKHLYNFAVDFQTLDEEKKPYQNHDEVDQRLCEFWHKQGRKHQLGLGLYSKQRFHIDTQSYRTWGIGYRSATSPCLKPRKDEK